MQPSGCVRTQPAGILADFGHRRSIAAADQLIAQAEKVGFKGLHVEQRGCSDYAVVLPGIATVREGNSLRQEAHSVGLTVTLDCRSQAASGGIVAVFGRARTQPGALRLATRSRRFGFEGLDVVQTGCRKWQVLLRGLTTSAQRKALATEARRVGIYVTFEPG